VLSILLLFARAWSELSLPNLMSNIVNIGIQQSGIEEDAPEAISENGLMLLTYFTDEDGKTVLDDSYTLIATGSDEASEYLDEYPLLETENIYVLNDLSEEETTEVGTVYSDAAYAFMLYLQDTMGTSSETDITDMESIDIDVDELYQMLPYFAMMPSETFADDITTSQNADTTFTTQVGVAFTKIFYTELGVDTAAIQHNYILHTGIIMLLVTLAGITASITVGLFAARISAGVARDVRHDVFDKVEHFASHEFDQFSTASLITRSTNDITQIQMLILMGVRMICYAPIIGIGGIIMAVNKSPSLSWIIAVAVITLIGVIMIIFSIAMPKFRLIQNLVDRLNLVTRENLSGMMVIRAFGNQKYEEDRFEHANAELTGINLFVNRVMVFMMPFMMLLMNGMTLLIVWVGAHQIEQSAMQVGDMMAFMQYAMQIIFAFLMIAMMFIMVPRASVSANRIAEVLKTDLSITDPKDPKTFGGKAKGTVKFDHVSFRYHNAEADVLHDITFTAQPAQTTAFIGSTGSGKSTLVNLIPRFYDVTGGAITIDGIDVRDLSQKELRDNIGYVPQKGVLFSGTIDSNIRYGKEDADEEEVQLAAKIAQAEEFIEKKEDQFESEISQGGANVSGGQKQRLSIARALAKQAPIYIFDDSFSALDFQTDAALRKALQKYTGDSAVLIVAQRVSTIMSADQIIVLDEGKIVGIGTHSQLLKTCEVYREIAESQLSKEELA
jgi:ATP-binding cassette subfamily B protein